jgi:hypothetical protein
MEPSSGGQQLIPAKVYKWFSGASPYSQYCGGIRKLQWKTYLLQQHVKSYMCIKWHAKCQRDLPYVCVLLAVRKETVLWILLAVRKETVLWVLL